jgi:hypothetical protein
MAAKFVLTKDASGKFHVNLLAHICRVACRFACTLMPRLARA